MNLSKYEAYITRRNKIKFGSEDNDSPFLILNPIKGDYYLIKSRLLQILELNHDCILGVKFSNGENKWITTIGIDDDGMSNILVYYNTYEQAKGVSVGNDHSVMSISNKLSNIEKLLDNYDANICQVIRKGVLK